MGGTCIKGDVNKDVCPSHGSKRDVKSRRGGGVRCGRRRSSTRSQLDIHRCFSAYYSTGFAPPMQTGLGDTRDILSSGDDMLSIPSLHLEEVAPPLPQLDAAPRADACRINPRKVEGSAREVDAVVVFDSSEFHNRCHPRGAAASEGENMVPSAPPASVVGVGNKCSSSTSSGNIVGATNASSLPWSFGRDTFLALKKDMSAHLPQSPTLFSCRSLSSEDGAGSRNSAPPASAVHDSDLRGDSAVMASSDVYRRSQEGSVDANRTNKSARFLRLHALLPPDPTPYSADESTFGDANKNEWALNRDIEERQRLPEREGNLVHAEESCRDLIKKSEEDIWQEIVSLQGQEYKQLMYRFCKIVDGADEFSLKDTLVEPLTGSHPLMAADEANTVLTHQNMEGDHRCASSASGAASQITLLPRSMYLSTPVGAEGCGGSASSLQQTTRESQRRRGGLLPPAASEEVLAMSPICAASSEREGGGGANMHGSNRPRRGAHDSASPCSLFFTGMSVSALEVPRTHSGLKDGCVVGVGGMPRSGESVSQRLLFTEVGHLERHVEPSRLIDLQEPGDDAYGYWNARDTMLTLGSRRINDFTSPTAQNAPQGNSLPENHKTLMSPFSPFTSSSPSPENWAAKMGELGEDDMIYRGSSCRVGLNPPSMQSLYSTSSLQLGRRIYSPKPGEPMIPLSPARESTIVGPAPRTRNAAVGMGNDSSSGRGGGRRRHPFMESGRHVCKWCSETYGLREVCTVAHETHSKLRQKRCHEKHVKKQAQELLRSGRIQEAVERLKVCGLI